MNKLGQSSQSLSAKRVFPRIKTPDRQVYRTPVPMVQKQIRNVSVDNQNYYQDYHAKDPTVTSATNDETYNNHPTISQEFRENYSKAGLQPRSILDEPNSPTAPEQTRNVQVTNEPVVSLLEKMRSRRELPNPNTLKPKALSLKSKAINTELRMACRAFSGFAIWSWAFIGWTIQLFFIAIPSALFLGMGLLLDAASSPNENDSIIAYLVKSGVQLTGSLANDVAGFLGFDLTMAHPFMLVILCMFIMFMFYGLIQSLLIFIIYTLAGFHPLSGRGEGMKKGALLLSIIGYTLPLLNFFPWFLVWTWAVIRNPR